MDLLRRRFDSAELSQMTDGRSVIAAVPLNPGTLRSTIVSAASPAMSAPDSRQGTASPSNSPQTAPLNAIPTAVTASTKETTTELPKQPVAASNKSQKTVRNPNQRN